MAAADRRKSLDKLEEKLMTEMDNILLQEEVYWKQQARMLWLKDGERNTKFFNSWAKQRKRENRIHQLKLEN